MNDRENWTVADWKAEAAEMKRQRDLKEVVIQRLKAWRRAVCAEIGIKVRTSSNGAVMEITKLRSRPRR